MLLEVAGDKRLDGVAILVVECASSGQVLGERPSLVECPSLERGNELCLIDQAVLEGEQTKEEVA